ncbi:MAG TPA: hypothetical protein VES65_09910 [Solirubrobacteraceae bacterium]|nr:hypothetical protein [Solirubrobacteraceae bacterium]
MRTGISAAGEHGLELVSGDELDLYMREDRVEALVAEHALRPVTLAEANVTLRAVSPDAWHLDGRSVAPIATVALDLADHQNPRLARIGRELLERMVPSHDH